jgi:hypothetical protein
MTIVDSDSDVDQPTKIWFKSQNARMIMECIECRKPCVLYSFSNLTERQQIALLCGLEQYDYTCGGPILDPDHSLSKKVSTREGLACAIPESYIETASSWTESRYIDVRC